jgi:hypothetical protein
VTDTELKWIRRSSGLSIRYPHDEISIGGLRALERSAELTTDERSALLGGTASRLISQLVPPVCVIW